MRVGRHAMRLGGPADTTTVIGRNAVAVLGARVLAAVITTVVVVIAAHRLDAEDFGLVVSTMAAGFILNTAITFGTDTVVTRSVAAGDSDAESVARAALRLQLALASVAVLGTAVAVAAGAPRILLVEAVSMIPLAVVTVTGAVVRGHQRMHHLLSAAAAGSAVTLTATIVGFMLSDDVAVPIAARLLGAAASAVVLARTAAARRSPTSAPALGTRALVGRAAPFAGMVILAAIGAQCGVLLVELAGDEPSGGYGAASRLLEASRLVPAAAVTAFFPAMMDGLHHTEQYRRWTRRLFGYSVIVLAVLVLAAGPIDRILFDRQPDGVVLIRVLAFALPPTIARLLLSFEAIAEGRERNVLLSAAAATASMLGAGLVAALTVGPAGVAWAQVGSAVVAVLFLVVDRLRSAAGAPSPPVRMGEGGLGHR